VHPFAQHAGPARGDDGSESMTQRSNHLLGPATGATRRLPAAAGRGASKPVAHCPGWTIAFQPQLFARHVAELKAEVKRLKQELDPQAFVQHPHGACC
jgi:hypothetical protein